jgi:hypothetical protein
MSDADDARALYEQARASVGDGRYEQGGSSSGG